MGDSDRLLQVHEQPPHWWWSCLPILCTRTSEVGTMTVPPHRRHRGVQVRADMMEGSTQMMNPLRGGFESWRSSIHSEEFNALSDLERRCIFQEVSGRYTKCVSQVCEHEAEYSSRCRDFVEMLHLGGDVLSPPRRVLPR